MPLRFTPDIDDRRTCGQCTQIGQRGPCNAARIGAIVASRQYEPDRTLLRRCEAYRPDRTDPDQRSGLQRWPGLTTPPTIQEKNKK